MFVDSVGEKSHNYADQCHLLGCPAFFSVLINSSNFHSSYYNLFFPQPSFPPPLTHSTVAYSLPFMENRSHQTNLSPKVQILNLQTILHPSHPLSSWHKSTIKKVSCLQSKFLYSIPIHLPQRNSL